MLPLQHPTPLMRNKPVGWRKYQPVIFTAILIGFPLTNVLLFFCTQMFPLVRPSPPIHSREEHLRAQSPFSFSSPRNTLRPVVSIVPRLLTSVFPSS